MKTEEHESYISLADNHFITLRSIIRLQGYDGYTTGRPEDCYPGHWEMCYQELLEVSCDTLDRDWLMKNITDGMIRACFDSDELYDDSVIEFRGKDK